MHNRLETLKRFSLTFREGLRKKYEVVPANSFIATQFNLRSIDSISAETARKWSTGIAFPSPGKLPVLIEWLDLNANDFLAELPVNNGPDSLTQPNKVFTQGILDSLTLQIAVINSIGTIIEVNQAWKKFADANFISLLENFCVGCNYLDVCEKSLGSGVQIALQMGIGINKVLNGELKEFFMRYPCHTQNKNRWIIAGVTPLKVGDNIYTVISHQAISKENYLKQELD